MKKCTLNLRTEKSRAQSNHRVPILSGIVMMAMLLTAIGCSNLESDLSVEPSEAGTEENATSSVQADIPASQKCLSIGQEITDRGDAYNAAYIAEDVDLLYNDFWVADHHEFVPNWDKDRDQMRTQMTWFYERGNLYSFHGESLERYVYNDVVYDFGVYDNDGDMNGIPFLINGYYFMRWIKESDGVWRVDKSVGGPTGDTVEIHPTTDAGPVICNNQQESGNTVGNEAAIRQEITARYEAYKQALASGNVATLSGFWTEDVHYYGSRLDLNRDALYQYYSQFFATGSIVSNSTLRYRFVHNSVVYDIGQAEETETVNGVQKIKKKNYVIRWEKGPGGVWRIHRIMNLFRVN